MSRDPKLPRDEAWDAVEKTALSEEARRVAKLSDAGLDRELEKKNVDAKALRERGAALAAKLMAQQATKAPAPAVAAVPSPAPRAKGWTVWLVAAAVGALGATLLAMNFATVVAWFGPEPIGPDTADSALAGGPRERASKLRDAAVAACRASEWTTCSLKLDEARSLDPAGESEPRVVQARRDIADAEPSDAGPEKPEKLKP